MRTKRLFRRFCRLVGKGTKFFGILKHLRLKYLVLLVVALAMAHIVLGSATPRPLSEQQLEQARKGDSLAAVAKSTVGDTVKRDVRQSLRRNRRVRRLNDTVAPVLQRDSLSLPDSLAKPDSLTIASRSQRDTTARKNSGSPIDQIITGKNTDSLYYDVRNKRVYIYNQGDVKYDNMGLQADYMQIDMSTKEIYAYGKADSVDGQPKSMPVRKKRGTKLAMMMSVELRIGMRTSLEAS